MVLGPRGHSSGGWPLGRIAGRHSQGARARPPISRRDHATPALCRRRPGARAHRPGRARARRRCPLYVLSGARWQRAGHAHADDAQRIRARGLPCYQAHWSIDDLLRRGLQHKPRFRFRSYGARWARTWSCRSRWVEGEGSRPPAHHVSCTAGRARQVMSCARRSVKLPSPRRRGPRGGTPRSSTRGARARQMKLAALPAGPHSRHNAGVPHDDQLDALTRGARRAVRTSLPPR